MASPAGMDSKDHLVPQGRMAILANQGIPVDKERAELLEQREKQAPRVPQDQKDLRDAKGNPVGTESVALMAIGALLDHLGHLDSLGKMAARPTKAPRDPPERTPNTAHAQEDLNVFSLSGGIYANFTKFIFYFTIELLVAKQ